MRTVFNNNEVPHLWAAQSQEQARGNGAISFDGRTIYSYSEPIGKIIRMPGDGDPRGFVLLCSRSWSVTTSSHQSAASYAVNHMKSIRVYNVRATSVAEHANNLEHLRLRLDDALGKAKRAKKYADMHLSEAESIVNNANAYIEEFNLDFTRFALDDDHIAHINTAREVAARQGREAEVRRMAEQAEQRAAWVRGESVHLSYGGDVLLRINPQNPDQLQTSHGATVPLTHAIRIVKMAKNCRDAGVVLVPNNMVRVGDFTLTRINADGEIVAGCHRIAWAESERMANLVGVFDQIDA